MTEELTNGETSLSYQARLCTKKLWLNWQECMDSVGSHVHSPKQAKGPTHMRGRLTAGAINMDKEYPQCTPHSKNAAHDEETQQVIAAIKKWKELTPLDDASDHQPFAPMVCSVDSLIDDLESRGLGWSLDHTAMLIEARVWDWPFVIGRYRPHNLEPLAHMLAQAMYEVDWLKYPVKPTAV